MKKHTAMIDMLETIRRLDCVDDVTKARAAKLATKFRALDVGLDPRTAEVIGSIL